MDIFKTQMLCIGHHKKISFLIYKKKRDEKKIVDAFYAAMVEL